MVGTAGGLRRCIWPYEKWPQSGARIMVLIRRRNDKPTMLTCTANAVRNCGAGASGAAVDRGRHRRGLADGFAFRRREHAERISNARLPGVTGDRSVRKFTPGQPSSAPPNLIDVMADPCGRTIKNLEQLRVSP